MRFITWTEIYQDIVDIFGSEISENVALRAANRIFDDLKSTVNLPTQRRTAYISYAYDFERYAIPEDYKTNGKISLKYNNRIDNNSNRVHDYDEPFEHNRRGGFVFYDQDEWNLRDDTDMATIREDKGIEALWLANGSGSQTAQLISDCDSLTEWAGALGAGNLTLDSNVKAKGEYAINYDITAGTTPTVTVTLATAIDLSEYVEAGIIRLYKWLPTAPTSIEIQIGETSAKYYTQSVTAQADGLPFDTVNVNELELKFKDATLTGVPDMSAVTHCQIKLTFTTATTDTDFRIDEIKAYKSETLEFDYYSFYMVKNTSTGVWQAGLTETPGTDETLLILAEWRNQFVAGCVHEELDKAGDKRAAGQEKKYNEWITKLQRRYPSKSKKVGNSYW